MRLRQLALVRYGHLADAVLDFPADAPLCVVQGVNEAGKSTALAAISDALFGFGHRTDFDFLHGAPQLRVGFTVMAGDGREGRFIRRKGRSGTLRDNADEVIPDTALAPFLGGASRELFEQGFGLDGNRLRAGGRTLATGGGGVGESLFAAGTGLLGLREAQASIDEEAKSLFGSARGRRKVSEAVEGWRQAQRRVEQLSVQPKAHREAAAALEAATNELRELQGKSRELQIEASRLQRLRRVSPILVSLDAARRRFEDLAGVPTIPLDAEERLAAAIEARSQAARDATRESDAVATLTARRAEFAPDASPLAAQDTIDLLAEARHAAVQADGDLPMLRLAIEGHRATVAEALRELGLAVSPEAARDTVPEPSARNRVRTLAREHAGLAAAAAAATKAEASARTRREKADAALAAHPAPPDPAVLRQTITMVRGEGRLDADLAEAESTADATRRKADAALAALPLWTGDADGLAACPVPLQAEVASIGTELEASQAAAVAAGAAVAKTEAELASAEERLRSLAEGGTVPTPAAVAAARKERDATWRRVRQLLGGEPPPEATDPEDVADRFEQQRDDADRLADRRADEAHRVADFLSETANRERLLQQRSAELEGQAEAAAGLQAASSRWRELWEPSGVSPSTVAAMAEWRRARDEVLRLHSEAMVAARRRDLVAGRGGAARAALLAQLPGGSSGGTIASLLAHAEATCAAAEERQAAYRALAEGWERETAALPELEAATRDAEAALEDWRAKWGPAVAQLGLAEDTAVADAEAALAAWSRIAETAPAWRQDAKRMEQQQETAASFRASVEAALAAIGAPPLSEPASAAAARLLRQLEEARKAEAEAASLTKRIEETSQALAEARRRGEAAEADLAELRRIARVEDDAALAAEIERDRRRDTTEKEISKLEAELGAQGDGLDEAALRAEAAGADADGAAPRLDAAAARLRDIDDEVAALGVRREELSTERARTQAELEGMQRGQDAAGALQEQQQFLAEAAAAAGRYAQLHVARVLLHAGIERFRRVQQGPLLAAASRHFAALTRGRYPRLGTDEDAAGKPLLVAIQRDGTECPVDGLSEGARDQLFLALRVAAIEAHVASSEPLPFVADDLLVHFDDDRAVAAVELLIELGRSTQVILFTHHDHVASIAEARGSSGTAVVRWRPFTAAARMAAAPTVAE
ncbi:AAA family ATPase [Roseomonas hellenica]|uniref:AAA family ATPase n=1 Tax=Plastoroseomonas hellenica TaxID=2687306 RepID=A0ABS5EVQ5_9PROT|nr:YhaN family protein [Plastoroseomonas hellenica]MBR0664386.1 AAA family ATPase [Plastoroseomonas hellenica]